MAPRSSKELQVGGGADGYSAQGGYKQEIINEVVKLLDGEFKFFQHADGKGETMLTKVDGTATAVSTRYGSNFIKRKHGTITTVRIDKDGVSVDVRDL